MRDRRTLILNFKNYTEVLGAKSLELARAAERVSSVVDVEIVVAPPTPMIGAVASAVNNRVFSQKAEVGIVGRARAPLSLNQSKRRGRREVSLTTARREFPPPG